MLVVICDWISKSLDFIQFEPFFRHLLWQTFFFLVLENFATLNKKASKLVCFLFLLLLLCYYAFTRVHRTHTHVKWQIQLFNAMMTSNVVLIVLFQWIFFPTLCFIRLKQLEHKSILLIHFAYSFDKSPEVIDSSEHNRKSYSNPIVKWKVHFTDNTEKFLLDFGFITLINV